MRLAFILSMHFLLLPTEFSPHNHSSPMSGEVSRSDGERSKLRFVRVVLPTEFSPHNHSSPMSGEVLRSDGEVSCWENWENWEAQ